MGWCAGCQYTGDDDGHGKQGHLQPEFLGLFPERGKNIPAPHQLDGIPSNNCRWDAVPYSRSDFPEFHQPLEQIDSPDRVEKEKYIGRR